MPSIKTRLALLNQTYRTAGGVDDALLIEGSTAYQPDSTTLTVLSTFNSVGLLTQTTTAPAFAGRTLTAGSTRVTITAGNGSTANPSVDVAAFPSTHLSDTAALARLNVASTWVSTQVFPEADIQGLLRCDSFRIDAVPTTSTAAVSHKIAVNFNGDTYFVLLSSA